MFDLSHLRVPQVSGLLALLAYHQVDRRGVLHVGAHYGLELESYLACGFSRILYVEANPKVYPRLEEHATFWREWIQVMQEVYGMDPAPAIETVLCAASDTPGQARLYLTECERQSSLLAPADPSIRTVDEVEVSARPLDELVPDLADFSLLTLDVQGAELQVLRGAPALLQQLKMVVVEVNFRRRYKGCPLASEIETFMEQQGYRAVARSQTVPWAVGGDVVYLRG